jgi:LytS/YehU family sensor histidine kinase
VCSSDLETENEKIEISKEMDVIKKYIDLEKIRLSNPDSVSFVCSIENDLLIPPMLFMPFIENGFKHCYLNKPDSKLSISFYEKNNELSFCCINSVNMQENDSKEKGIGLKLIKERLKLLYPNNHHLQIIQHNNEFDVNLKINFTND